MAAWTPDQEEFTPFDDEGELKEGLPNELNEFLAKFDVSKNFTMDLKKWNNEGRQGRAALVGQYEAVVPTFDAVVRMHGTGWYGFDIAWTPKGGKRRSEVHKIDLVGTHWEAIHKEAVAERKRKEIDDAEHEAAVARAKAGGVGTIPGVIDPRAQGKDYLRGMFADLKEFGFDPGGMMRGGGGGGDSNMLFLGMMGMMMKSQENSMNLLVTLLSANQNRNPMGEMVTMMREIFTLKDGLMPAEKSWIQDIAAVLAENIGPIMSMFQRPDAPDSQKLHQKMDTGLAETRAKAQADPNFAKELVKHMDAKVGAAMTDKILDGLLRVRRPGQAAPGGGTPPSAPSAQPSGAAPASAPGAGQEGKG